MGSGPRPRLAQKNRGLPHGRRARESGPLSPRSLVSPALRARQRGASARREARPVRVDRGRASSIDGSDDPLLEDEDQQNDDQDEDQQSATDIHPVASFGAISASLS